MSKFSLETEGRVLYLQIQNKVLFNQHLVYASNCKITVEHGWNVNIACK